MRNLILTLTLLSALFAPAFGQTQQDVAVLLSACQFFAGSPLDAQEQQRIIAGARTDFAKDATKARAEIQELRQLGTQLSQLSDPLRFARPDFTTSIQKNLPAAAIPAETLFCTEPIPWRPTPTTRSYCWRQTWMERPLT